MNKELLEYFNGDELAANVWLQKYAMEGEITPDQMHKRLAKEFARIEEKYYEKGEQWLNKGNLSNYGSTRSHLQENDIYELFKNFKYIIPQGSIMSGLGLNAAQSLSNCFVIGQPKDSFGGIFLKDQEMAQLMKRRGGVGIDISTLRPKGTSTSNAGGTSSGAISFMHKYSETTRSTAQNGRRGALMISIDINHPDVLEFIEIKRDLSKVTGANISIKLNKEFMEAVENDNDYYLSFPCTETHIPLFKELPKYGQLIENKGVYWKRVRAKEIWDEIIISAHGVAEPGLMFWDNMVEYAPDGVYEQYKPITTNPCSEIGMQEGDACRLIAVNLFSFVNNPFSDSASFDYEKFYRINYEAMRLSDDLIDLELEHIDRIISKIESDPESIEIKQIELNLWKKIKETASNSRRTGLGFTALGDTLAALGLRYDSDDALEEVELIMNTKMKSELDCTIDLAILRGTFAGWESNDEFIHDAKAGLNKFYQFLVDIFPDEAKKMSMYGRRNISFSTVAPTGSVSLLAQTTSGIEPLFMPYYIRRKKLEEDTELTPDFIDDNGDAWQEFPVLHPKFKDWLILNYTDEDTKGTVEEAPTDLLQALFEQSPWYGSTANDLNWSQRVKMQGVIQKYITHSISSTVNLPNDVSLDEVSNIYKLAHKQGLKGITVYRDGSRSGVLVSNDSSTSNFITNNSPKRPKSLSCNVHTTTSKGVKWNVIVGLLNDKPYEVFAVPYFTDIDKGELVKIKRGRYDLEVKGETYSEDITSDMASEEEAITRLVSTALRHGTDVKFLTEQLNKSNGDITSFGKAISRVIKKYIPDGTKSTVTCNECGSENVIFEEGCNKCLDCGSSKCG